MPSGIKQARITGVGCYLPSKILTNQDLEKIVDTTDEWIVTRTGMKERRIASEDEHASYMGVESAKKAMSQAGVISSDVDLILVATMTPDYLTPSTSTIIQHELGCSNIAALDISAACTGFLYAIATAKAYIESGMAHCVLVIATEKLSSFINWADRRTCVLFGDGAASCVVQSSGAGWLIGQTVLGADGSQQNLFKIAAGGSRCPATQETVLEGDHYLTMEGTELFRHAVRRLCQVADECIEKNNLRSEDLDWIVCHQANSRILDAVTQKLGAPAEKVYKTLHKYGNTSASSVLIAFHELCQEPSLKTSDKVLIMAFGAGLTWGAAVLQHTS
jgi:3-oxoacyl-[acyl-carrier-protein] synthase-3